MDKAFFSIDFALNREDVADHDLEDYLAKVCDAVEIKGVEQINEEFGIIAEPLKTSIVFADADGNDVGREGDWKSIKGSVQFWINPDTLPPPLSI